MAHFVAFFISFQNIVTLKLPFGANRGYWWFKNLLFTGKSLTDFRQKYAVFAPKWSPNMHKLCLSHQSWIFMIFIMRKRVIISKIIHNNLIIQFFQFSAIFQYNRIILPKISLKPQRPEWKQGLSCRIFHKFSENHSLENPPPPRRGEGNRGYWWLMD
jgi:hypothetical protein